MVVVPGLPPALVVGHHQHDVGLLLRRERPGDKAEQHLETSLKVTLGYEWPAPLVQRIILAYDRREKERRDAAGNGTGEGDRNGHEGREDR